MQLVDVVRIGPDDWRELREVRLASLLDAPDAFGSRHEDWADATEQRWRSRLSDVALTLVARHDGVPVGLVAGVQAEHSVELISMWVAPEHRGTGLAGRLVAAVVTWAARRGAATSLLVREHNVAAIRAYTRAGFVDCGVPDGWSGTAPRERRMWHRGDVTVH